MNVRKQVLCITIMNELITALKRGIVVISFKKIDSGEIRVMPSTLNEKLMPDGVKTVSYTHLTLPTRLPV